MKSSKRAFKILLILLGIVIVILVLTLVKPNLDTQKSTLEAENKKLTEQLMKLTELEANLATYQTQQKQFEEDNVEILNQFPVELRAEDAIMYAKKIENTSDMEISTVGVAPGSLVYALNGDNLDDTGLATVAGTDTAAATGTDTTAATGTDTTAAAGTDAAANAAAGDNAAAAAVSSTEELGILEESQVEKPDYNLYDMVVSYDFKTSYEDLKKIFGNILDNNDKRNVGDIAITYDEDSGKLIGNMTVNMYFVTGTDKVYEAPDTGTMKHGLSNIFGTLKKADSKKSGGEKTSGSKKKKKG